MKEYDIVVIGSGNAGISAAVALAQQGERVLVLEQHNLPGGCASSFVRGRFEFDVSLHSMDYFNVFKPIVTDAMGLKSKFPGMPDEMDYITCKDGKMTRDLYHFDTMADEVEAAHPGCGESCHELMKIYRDMNQAFGQVMMASGPEEVGAIMQQHPYFAKYGQYTVDQIYDELNVPEYTRSILNNFWWYMGIKPVNAQAALYSMLAGGEYFDTQSYPERTAHGYLAEMETVIRKNGGDVWYNTSAEKINVKNSRIESVETSQGDVIKTSYVMCNCDPRRVVAQMLNGVDAPEAIVKKEETAEENFSFFMIYLGMDISAQELGIRTHHTFIHEDTDINRVFDEYGSFEGDKTIGVLCPNYTVPDISPEGTCILSISVPVHGRILDGLNQREYIRKKHEFEKDIIKRVEKYMGIDIESHIEEIDTATPATLSRFAGLFNGSLGNDLNGPDIMQKMAIGEELNQMVPGLSFVGQYTGSLGYRNVISGYVAGMQVALQMKEGK